MNNTTKNRYMFGLGTLGRDMVYSLVSMYLIYFLTDVLKMTDTVVLNVTTVMFAARIFDAANDPIMGTIVDNTHTKWGKFKPWILFGAIISGILTVLLFTDFGLRDSSYVMFFGFVYILWGIAFTTNDISYWSMVPALTNSQKERENISAFARICANIGLFSVVCGLIPVTNILAQKTGSLTFAFTIFAIGVVAILWIFQCFTVFGVTEERRTTVTETTSLKGMIKAIFKNDQLLVVCVSMCLFMIGYMTTTSFGLYYFKYVFKNEGMYSVFALILGISQLAALSLFPLFSKRLSRKQLYTISTLTVIVGYLVFFFSPQNMLFIGIAGLLIFFSQAIIQLLMLVFLADTVEYGQWKLGKRNESVTFSLQPFINKLGGAISSAVVGYIVVLSGINNAVTPEDVSNEGLLLMKIAMLLFPLISIVISFVIYLRGYKIHPEFYEQITKEIQEREQNH